MTDFKRYKVKYILLYLKKLKKKNAEMKIIFFFLTTYKYLTKMIIS